MPKLLSKLDPGVAIAFAIGLLAVWPLFAYPSLPLNTDAEIHILRAAEVKESILSGVLYPRWANDFYYGNGYPIFSFYAPLTYHLAAYWSIITGTDVVAGSKAVLVGSGLLGTLGMYLFVRNRWWRLAGIVAAAAWAFSPYLIFLEPHARGEIAETLSLGIAPFVLLWFDIVLRRGGWRPAVMAAISLAAVILAHPLTALPVYGVVLVLIGWEVSLASVDAQRGRQPFPWERIPHVAVAIVLGLGLAAVYWLPAGLERSAVRLDFYGLGHYDFRRHFLPVNELAALPLWLDEGAANPEFRFSLGPVQLLLAIAGMLTVFKPRLRRLDSMLMVFLSSFFLYLMTNASQGLWEVLPPMRFFQFPMRFLGPTALVLSPLAGTALAWIGNGNGKPRAPRAAALMVAALFLSALPLTYPLPWSDFGAIDRGRVVQAEISGKWLGTTCCNDFLPRGVESIPVPSAEIVAAYTAGDRIIPRAEKELLPAGASVIMLHSTSQSDALGITTPSAFKLKLHRFYFPGWTAMLDGKPVEISVTQPDGRIGVDIPAGKHRVDVELQATPVRGAAAWISITCALAALGLLLLPHSPAKTSAAAHGPTTELAQVAIALVAVVCIKLLSDQLGWFRHHSSGRTVATAQHSLLGSIQKEIEFLGYDMDKLTLRKSTDFPVTLYWRALRPPSVNYQVYVHLRDKDGKVWAQSDKANPADTPTKRWALDRYIRDLHTLALPAVLPAGEYRVYVGLWNDATSERFLAYDEDGVLMGENIALPDIVTVR